MAKSQRYIVVIFILMYICRRTRKSNMKKAAIIIGNNVDLKKLNFDDTYVVAVERGCLKALNDRIHIDVAIGDFDSINMQELKEIYDKVEKVIKLNPIKDDTDTYSAYKLVRHFDKISIIGGIQGRRIEHFLAILNLLKMDKKIEILDDFSSIVSLDSRDEPYVLAPSEYKFISLFALDEAEITLENFKYPLDHYHMIQDDSLGISNEILPKKVGKIFLSKGRILLIKSKADA